MKKGILPLAVLPAVFALLAGCATGMSTAKLTGIGSPPAAGDSYAADLTPEEAYNLLQKNSMAVLLDVRTQAEYVFVGHPNGAVNIPIEFWDENTYKWSQNPDFDGKVKKRITRETPIITMCRSGNRSRTAANRLTGLGFRTVYNMTESFEGSTDKNTGQRTVSGWKNRGLPYTYDLVPELMYWP